QLSMKGYIINLEQKQSGINTSLRLPVRGGQLTCHGDFPPPSIRVRPNFDPLSSALPALEHIGRAFEQGPFQLMDHRQMHPEPARQLGRCLFTLQASSATFALNSVACCVRFDISAPLLGEDQQTANRSLFQCPNFGAAPTCINMSELRVPRTTIVGPRWECFLKELTRRPSSEIVERQTAGSRPFGGMPTGPRLNVRPSYSFPVTGTLSHGDASS
ncbi:hypothetical protein, partial [Thioclava sp.]|uniref:hypothetical protein n=1 Tax=Thioclava sp. TaxID=1933450 RepID=UPI0032425611